MTGVTRVGQRSFASNQRCWCQRANSDWGASSWRQWCATPMLYPALQRRIAWFADSFTDGDPRIPNRQVLAMMALGNCGQCRVGSEAHVFRRTYTEWRNCSEPPRGQQPAVTKRLWMCDCQVPGLG